MRIGFYAPTCIPIHARSLDERPLGGTETALVRVAENLQARGHDVVVFTAHENPPVSSPLYLPCERIRRGGTFDVMIAVKEWSLGFLPLPNTLRFLWTGDGAEQFSNFGIGDKRIAGRFHGLFVASEWHGQTLCAASGYPRERTFNLSNGVHLPFFVGEEKRHPKRLLYASAPYRGLQFMPEIFQALRAKHPEIELHVFAGLDVYRTTKAFAGPEAEQARVVEEALKKIPGCVLHGNVTQKELAREYMRASILVYPNSVAETCCIVALEAQAGGCVPVASNIGGHGESIGTTGILIPGTPERSGYREEFIKAVDGLLSNPEQVSVLRAKALERARMQLGWDKVVDRLELVLARYLVTRP